MARIRLEPLRGFRDILAPESLLLTRLAEIFRQTAELHGYEEVKPPTLERFEIFALKSGEEIRKTMYVFRDKAGREVALRPEATASIARIYLRHLRGRPKPLRLYYVVNCFRYEEPQRARYREFWQAGIEILGEPSLAADFEAIKMLLVFYDKIGFLENIRLKLGTTKLYRTLFSEHGVPEGLQDHILHLMDKGLYSEALEELRNKNYERLADILAEIWKSKKEPEKVREIVSGISPIAEGAVKEVQQLAENITSYNSRVQLDIDLSFARGLAYYTGIIYEVKVPGFPVSIAGGGRYDSLVKLYGDEDVPGTGFAIGLDRTMAALQEAGVAGQLLPRRRRAAVLILDPSLASYAAKVQDTLVEKGIVAPIMRTEKLQKTLTKIVKQGYDYAVIVGEKEASSSTVTLKDIRNREQRRVTLEELRSIKL